MENISTESIRMEKIRAFTFIGDPGCDGLGAEIMSIFNAALREASGDFVLVGGDIVPNGARCFYESVTAMVDTALDKPIYMLCGNHDTEDYAAFFGEKNYFIYDDRLLLVVLDDSKRVFSQDSLELLERALKTCARDNIVLSFHIPPPNHVVRNSVSQGEWNKVLDVIEPYKARVRYILCGHIHSYFEDIVDGMRMISTGGGGARIENVENVDPPFYHFVEFTFDGEGKLTHEKKDVTFRGAADIPQEILSLLREAYVKECTAHVRYQLYAEESIRQQKPGLAKLFTAASDSEFYHARNYYFVMREFLNVGDAIRKSASYEDFEIRDFYKNALELAKSMNCGLPAYAFEDASEAEKVHMELFQSAIEASEKDGDIPELNYFTCTSCGYTFAGESANKICPVCGAPHDKIK